MQRLNKKDQLNTKSKREKESKNRSAGSALVNETKRMPVRMATKQFGKVVTATTTIATSSPFLGLAAGMLAEQGATALYDLTVNALTKEAFPEDSKELGQFKRKMDAAIKSSPLSEDEKQFFIKNVNFRSAISGCSPLYYVLSHPNLRPDIVQLLLDNGAEIAFERNSLLNLAKLNNAIVALCLSNPGKGEEFARNREQCMRLLLKKIYEAKGRLDWILEDAFCTAKAKSIKQPAEFAWFMAYYELYYYEDRPIWDGVWNTKLSIENKILCLLAIYERNEEPEQIEKLKLVANKIKDALSHKDINDISKQLQTLPSLSDKPDRCNNLAFFIETQVKAENYDEVNNIKRSASLESQANSYAGYKKERAAWVNRWKSETNLNEKVLSVLTHYQTWSASHWRSAESLQLASDMKSWLGEENRGKEEIIEHVQVQRSKCKDGGRFQSLLFDLEKQLLIPNASAQQDADQAWLESQAKMYAGYQKEKVVWEGIWNKSSTASVTEKILHLLAHYQAWSPCHWRSAPSQRHAETLSRWLRKEGQWYQDIIEHLQGLHSASKLHGRFRSLIFFIEKQLAAEADQLVSEQNPDKSKEQADTGVGLGLG